MLDIIKSGGPADLVVDCDTHPELPNVAALRPYLSGHWADLFADRGVIDLQTANYPPKTPLAARPDWRPASGKPAATLGQIRSELLEPFGIDIAICNFLAGAPMYPNPDMAATLASALNDYIVAEWLDPEPRLRAGIVIVPGNPVQAAAEVDRVARDPRFLHVMMPVSNEMTLGRRLYWPIYEACCRNGLALYIHAGSTFRHPLTAAGPTHYYYHDYASQAPAFQAQLNSMVVEGVFAEFPDLRVVMAESGVTWVPPILTRTDKFWRGLRMETPWVKVPPSELVRKHVRFTLTPFDAPQDAAIVRSLLEQLGGDEMLLFSTDYPHWHFDGTAVIPEGFTPDQVHRIAVSNPKSTFARL